MTNLPVLEDHRENQIKFWKVDQDPFIIGRGDTAQLVIAVTAISREHALIRMRGKEYLIQDLDSRNGTFINGVRLGREACVLNSGDQIVLGGEILLIYRDPNETSTGAAVGRLHGVWVDEISREVWVDRYKIVPPVTPQQFALLQLLYSEPGRVFSRNEIITTVWADVDPSGVGEEAVDSVIKRLRARLRENPEKHDYFMTSRGYGVMLVQPDE